MSITRLPAGPIHHVEHGAVGAPPVVFVHGALVDGTLWRKVAPAVADLGYHCFVPDWPLGSHSEPMAPDADLSPRGVARVILDFLAHHDLHDVCLVANDTGGAITQFVLDIDASRISRVVFTNCDTFDRFPPPPFRQLFHLASLPGALRVMLPPLRSTFIRHRLGFDALMATPIDAAQTRAWIEPARTQPGIRRDMAKLVRGIDPADLTDNATRLDRFAGPVLLTWGTEDRLFRLEDGRRLAACFHDATVIEIEGSSTFVAHDRPERLTQEIGRFLGAEAPAGQPAGG